MHFRLSLSVAFRQGAHAQPQGGLGALLLYSKEDPHDFHEVCGLRLLAGPGVCSDTLCDPQICVMSFLSTSHLSRLWESVGASAGRYEELPVHERRARLVIPGLEIR